MYEHEGSIQVEETDQCWTCEHFTKGIMCPFIEGLACGVTVMAVEELLVQNCGFYKEFKRHLTVVKES